MQAEVMNVESIPQPAAEAAQPSSRWAQYYALTKPRVVQLIVFCAFIGMVLAVPGAPTWQDWGRMLAASAGIWLVAAAAAAFNCLVERTIDARMKRTAWRPTARGELSHRQALVFSALLCAAGASILVLGWAAMTGQVGHEALLLFLIIFLWTPPHFWALALYRVEDYRRAGLPMLPVTHGNAFTRLQVFLYTVVLFAGCLLPFVVGMSGYLYLFAAVVLGLGFCGYGWALLRNYSDALARKTFRFSLIHLSLLFAALLVDHYLT